MRNGDIKAGKRALRLQLNRIMEGHINLNNRYSYDRFNDIVKTTITMILLELHLLKLII